MGIGNWVLGIGVNLASRVEELTKKYRVSLLISHHTFLALTIPSDYDTGPIDRVYDGYIYSCYPAFSTNVEFLGDA